MNNTLDLITDYLKRHLDDPPEEITPESRLEDIGVDSLAGIELIFDLEEEYGITIPDEVPMPETVGGLIEIVEKYKAISTDE